LIKLIEADTFLEIVELGMTVPLKISGSDHQVYYLKALQSEEGHISSANEWICYHLLKQFTNIAVPDMVLMSVSNEFIEKYRNELPTHNNDETIKPGVHIAFKEVPKPIHFVDSPLDTINNPEVAASILLFDHLIQNEDRGDNEGNILYSMADNQIYAIDHGGSFCSTSVDRVINNWIPYPSNFQIMNLNDQVYAKLLKLINNSSQFDLFQSRFSKITTSDLNEIINSIPSEWRVPRAYSQNILSFLTDRLKNLDTIVNTLKVKINI